MCRTAILEQKKIHVPTVSPANCAVMNGAVSAKERRPKKIKCTKDPVEIINNLRRLCMTLAFAPDNGGQDYQQQGYQSQVDGLPAVVVLQSPG